MRFGIARGLLRWISGACLGRDGAALQPAARAGGKPWWWDAEALRFSVSHSGDWIDLAFAWQIEVGVDVQAMPQRIDMEGIAALAMHPDEEALLRSIADQTERERLFLAIWAGREACLKATGEGIFADRRTLSVRRSPCSRAGRASPMPMAGASAWMWTRRRAMAPRLPRLPRIQLA